MQYVYTVEQKGAKHWWGIYSYQRAGGASERAGWEIPPPQHFVWYKSVLPYGASQICLLLLLLNLNWKFCFKNLIRNYNGNLLKQWNDTVANQNFKHIISRAHSQPMVLGHHPSPSYFCCSYQDSKACLIFLALSNRQNRGRPKCVTKIFRGWRNGGQK